jgi:hypothetical protein
MDFARDEIAGAGLKLISSEEDACSSVIFPGFMFASRAKSAWWDAGRGSARQDRGAIRNRELRAARRPPCAKAARTFNEPAFVVNELTMDEDLSGRRWLRRREPIALHQGL